jgi:hypothetical protein
VGRIKVHLDAWDQSILIDFLQIRVILQYILLSCQLA